MSEPKLGVEQPLPTETGRCIYLRRLIIFSDTQADENGIAPDKNCEDNQRGNTIANLLQI